MASLCFPSPTLTNPSSLFFTAYSSQKNFFSQVLRIKFADMSAVSDDMSHQQDEMSPQQDEMSPQQDEMSHQEEEEFSPVTTQRMKASLERLAALGARHPPRTVANTVP